MSKYCIEDLKERLGNLVMAELDIRYNCLLGLDSTVKERIMREWNETESVSAVQALLLTYELTTYLRSHKTPYKINGALSSSLISWLLGITFTNPLPAHRYCPHCKTIEWHQEYDDGFDIPGACCPNCGEEMESDGHNILSGIFWNAPKPTIEISIEMSKQEEILQWLSKNPLADKKNEWQPKYYIDGSLGIVYIGALHLAFGNYNFTSDFYERHISLHDLPAMLGVNEDQRKKYQLPEPESFSQLVASNSILKQMAGVLPKHRKVFSKDLSCCRDSIYLYLIRHGIPPKTAWIQMKQAIFGKGISCITEEMKNAPDSYMIEVCSTCTYLWPKSAIVEGILHSLRKNEDGENNTHRVLLHEAQDDTVI